MNTQITFLVTSWTVLSVLCAVAQPVPSYRDYQASGYAPGAIAFLTCMIADDYGPRNNGGMNWHGGVDYNSEEDDRDLLLSLESGTITKINLNSAKYIIVEGAHCFAYTHIFNDDDMFPIQHGHCRIYQTMESSMPCIVVQVDGGAYALGTEPGEHVMHNNEMLTVRNTVSAGEGLAALGGSGGYEPHLHLSLHPIGTTNPNNDPTSYDPAQAVQHDSPNYDIEIEDINGMQGVIPAYPGTQKTSFVTRARIDQCTQVNRYVDLMTVDGVEVKIRKDYESPADEVNIIGSEHEASFWHGARLGVTPNILTKNNQCPQGSWNTTGIDPLAYNTNNSKRWDDYYYPEFYTRIHKDDALGLPILFAQCPQDARYNDGRYKVRTKVTTSDAVIQYSPLYDLDIDNFKPFVESVQVSIGGTQIYDRYWECDACGGIRLGGQDNDHSVSYSDFLLGINITAQTSESVTGLSLSIPLTNVSGLSGSPGGVPGENRLWNFYVHPDDLLGQASLLLEFTASDYNGNTLLELDDYREASCVQIPLRTGIGPNDWSNPAGLAYGTDRVHSFSVSCGSGLPGSGSRMGPIITIEKEDCFENGGLEAQITKATGPTNADGEIVLVVSSGIAPFVFLWDDGPTTPVRTDLLPGEYCVTVQDAYCCEAHRCYTVGICGTLSITGVIGEPTLPFCDDGSVDILVQGGSGIFAYYWEKDGTFFSSEEDLYDLFSGHYELEVLDINTCDNGRYEFQLNDCCPVIMLPNPIVRKYYCDDIKGSIAFDNSVSGGTAPYTYIWSNGNTTYNNLNLSPGEYCLRVRDVNNCFSEEYCYTVENSNINIVVTSFVNNTICDLSRCNGEIDIEVKGGSGFFSYSWSSLSGGFTSSDQDIQNLCEGLYTVVVSDQITDCVFTMDFEICCCNKASMKSCDYLGQPFQIRVTKVPPNIGLNNGEIILTPIGGTGNYFAFWESPSEYYGRNSLKLSDLESGTYCVKITDGCNTIDKCIQLTNCEETTIQAVVTNSCPSRMNGTIKLLLSEFDIETVSWDHGTSEKEIVNLGAGTYSGSVITRSGCYIPFSFNIIEDWGLVIFEQSHKFISTTHYPTCGDPIPIQLLVCIEKAICKGEQIDEYESNPNRLVGQSDAGSCYSIDACQDSSVKVNPTIPMEATWVGSHGCPCCYEIRCPYWSEGIFKTVYGDVACKGRTDLGNGLCKFTIKCKYVVSAGVIPEKACVLENTIDVVDDCGRFCVKEFGDPNDNSIRNKDQYILDPATIKLYPSLSNDGMFTMNINQNVIVNPQLIEIVSQKGDIVNYEIDQNGSEFSCRPLKKPMSGMYFVRIKLPGNLITRKIIIL